MAPDSPTIQEVIAELKKREEEATPRPWIVDTRGSLVLCSILQVPHDIMEESVVDFVNRESDADLIVAMRNQLPELLAYVAKLETTVTTLEKQAADWREEEEHARMDRNLEDT